MSQSQISVHQERPSSSARRTVEAGCKVLKLISDFGLSFDIASGKVKPGNPNLIVIGRMVSAFNAHDQKGENPTDAAAKFVNSQKLTYQLNPHIKIWEGHNEFNPQTIEEVAWWALFEAARVDMLNQIGLRSVVGNFSTGVPDVAWWDAFIPALKAVDEGNGYVGIHEYIAGKFLDANGNIREPEGILRHEPIHARAFAPNKIKSHIIVTEFGVLDYRRVYSNGREYARDMFVVDAQVSATPYVDGLCVFTHGSANPAWDSYDVEGDEGFIEESTNHIRSHLTDTTPTPPVPPVDVPQPPRLKVGDTYKVIVDTLRVRNAPAGIQVATTIKGDKSVVVKGPVAKRLGSQILNWYQRFDGNWIAERQSGEWYLEKVEVAESGVNLIPNGDYTRGFTTPFMDTRFDPPRPRDNVRVPLGHWLKFLDDVIEPRLPRQDPFAPWLAPESVLRSGDTVKYPFTERLPDDELTLYLNAASPVAMHYFKLYGIMHLEQGVTIDARPGRYEYSIESYCDTHVKDHQFITNEAIASEWRLNVSGRPVVEWDNGATLPLGQDERKFFGHWRTSTVTFDHIGGPLSVAFEFRCRWGIEHVGVFLRNERLVMV